MLIFVLFSPLIETLDPFRKNLVFYEIGLFCFFLSNPSSFNENEKRVVFYDNLTFLRCLTPFINVKYIDCFLNIGLAYFLGIF